MDVRNVLAILRRFQVICEKEGINPIISYKYQDSDIYLLKAITGIEYIVGNGANYINLIIEDMDDDSSAINLNSMIEKFEELYKEPYDHVRVNHGFNVGNITLDIQCGIFIIVIEEDKIYE